MEDDLMEDQMTTMTDPRGMFTEYGGVPLLEFEDGGYRYGALGHLPAERVAVAIHARESYWPGAAELPVPDLAEGDVEHVWAVLEHSDGAADDDGWAFRWAGVTEETAGAFPMTVTEYG